MYQNNQCWAVKFVLPFVFLTEISNNFFKQFSQRWTADIHFQSCPSDSRSWILQDLLQKSTNKVFVCTYSCWESIALSQNTTRSSNFSTTRIITWSCEIGLNNPQDFLPNLDHLKVWANTTHCSGWVDLMFYCQNYLRMVKTLIW